VSDEPRILCCLTATKKWYGRLIRWASDSKVNHSFLKHEDSFWDDWRATEINEIGPHDCDVDRLQRIDYIEHWESDISLLKGMRAVRKVVGGSKYDWRGLLFGILRLIWIKATGRKVTKAVHSDNRWFCSEFVARVIKESGVPGTEDWEPENIAPGMLREFFLDSPHFHLVEDPTGG